MEHVRRIPVWGWLLILAVAVVVTAATMVVVTTPTSWEVDSIDGILVCDENGENCEPLEGS